MAEWFASWFDSPYYPVLYRHRDHLEAERFISRLVLSLDPSPDTRFLDLACGRGRHSRYLHSLGHTVTGVDLSPESIAEAIQHEEPPRLTFSVHDMRDPLPDTYDVILNLFTSFGYFESDEEHEQVLHHISKALRPGGIFVMDFMNAAKVKADLKPHYDMEADGIRFSIDKEVVGGKVIKQITVTDPAQPQPLHYQEQVRLFTAQELQSMFLRAGLHLQQCWGDYEGNAFDLSTSPRLILFASRKA